MSVSRPTPQKENLLVNLVFNVALPVFVLSKLSTPERLGPVGGLLTALAFPLGYGVWDFLRRRQANFLSIIGFVSVLLTGGLGLMHIGGLGFAIKEAAVPAIIGLAVLASMKTKRPLVRTFLYNPQVIDTQRIDVALAARGTQSGFERLMVSSTYLLALSFGVSAILNFALARYLLTAAPGTPAFNAQLGQMQLWNWPVIVLPSMAMTIFALWRLLSGIQKLTGLTLDEMFHAPAKKPA
ncbi:MAG TPA: VC0807 family protein [Opitutus sp.]|nr:VC0807 family protein [Opitutus sp.]